MSKIRLMFYNCLHCEAKGTPHKWTPRKPERPRICPKCKTSNWDRPLQTKHAAKPPKPIPPAQPGTN